MADALPLILSFPLEKGHKLSAKEYNKAIIDYVKKLSDLAPSTWMKPIDKNQTILDILDPAVNSIAYLSALKSQLSVKAIDNARRQELFTRCHIFFAVFDPVQVRYVGEHLWQPVFGHFLAEFTAFQIIDFSPISGALLRLDPTAGTLTSWHLDFVRACLKAGVPDQALPILDKNIYAIAQNPLKDVPDELLSDDHALSNAFITPRNGFTLKIHPESVLQYYLLGAQVYLRVRNFARARLFLEYVLLTPSLQHATSLLQVEAYKKWLLLGMLTEGKRYPLPRTADEQVVRTLKAIAKPYEALADDFEQRDGKKYNAEAEEGVKIWTEDGNLQMVQEVELALLRYRVIDLQRTYAALPISRVASHLSLAPDTALQTVSSMIRAGHLTASMADGTNGSGSAVLRFHHTSAPSARTQDEHLEAQTKRIEELVTFVRDADRRLQLTREYVDHQKRSKRAGQGIDGDLVDQMDMTWDAPVSSMHENEADEDIMA